MNDTAIQSTVGLCSKLTKGMEKTGNSFSCDKQMEIKYIKKKKPASLFLFIYFTYFCLGLPIP